MSFNNVELFKYDSKGKVRVWKAESDLQIDPITQHITITITHGQHEGKLQTKTRVVKDGKNKGKANETTIQQQTELELKSLYQKQLDDGYVFNIDDYKEPLRPMLAHPYKNKKHTVTWAKAAEVDGPADLNYASTKLNGIRCFIFFDFTGKASVIRFESRTGKPFKYFEHIALELVVRFSGKYRNAIFDGELFNPEIPFEIICSLVNSDEYVTVTDPETGKEWSTNDIEFHCYDIIDTEKPEEDFYTRFVTQEWADDLHHSLRYVKSVPVETEDEMVSLATSWIDLGYEGLMLRSGNTTYEFGKRSINLLKYKVMEQSEFKIKRIYLAENDETKVMFQVYNHFNEEEPYDTFDCALKGNKDLNLAYYEDREKHENTSWLTIDYQTLSAYKVPLFPVGITVRQGTVIDGKFVPEV